MDSFGPEHRFQVIQELSWKNSSIDSDQKFYDSLPPEIQELADEYGIEMAKEFWKNDEESLSPESYGDWMGNFNFG